MFRCIHSSARGILRAMKTLRSLWREELGQGLVLGTLAMIVILGFAALVLDVGMFLHEKREIQKAVDAAALAAAQELPDSWTEAEADAQEWLAKNDVDGTDGDSVDISFTCTSEYEIACDPATNKWDTVIVHAEREVPLNFAPLLGLDSITVEATAAGCRGLCGASPSAALDVMMVLDRTGSMSNGDMHNAQDAAKAILKVFEEGIHRVGLAVLGPARDTDDCKAEQHSCHGPWCNPPLPYPNLPDSRWVTTHLSEDFQNPDGSPDESSSLVANLQCLKTSEVGTDLGDPVWAATEELQTNGRAGEHWGMIVLSDGAANQPENGQSGSCGSEPDNYNPCEYAVEKAEEAKALGIEIYTIGYGVEDDDEFANRCVCDSGVWKNAPARDVLRAMASDDDHYFEEPKGGDLTPVFEEIAWRLVTDLRLVQ
jgi:Flp pilus assembly protein TadG